VTAWLIGGLLVVAASIPTGVAGWVRDLLFGAERPIPPWWFTKLRQSRASKRLTRLKALEAERHDWRSTVHQGSVVTYCEDNKSISATCQRMKCYGAQSWSA
jgi:hypothetical protein